MSVVLKFKVSFNIIAIDISYKVYHYCFTTFLITILWNLKFQNGQAFNDVPGFWI